MPAMVQEGILKEDPIPGFKSLSAVPVAVLVAVLVAAASLPPLAFAPVTVASTEDTVTVCTNDDPNVHVKTSPLTGVETMPSKLYKDFVPLVGRLPGE